MNISINPTTRAYYDISISLYYDIIISVLHYSANIINLKYNDTN